MLTAVILAGGAGTRLWPRSRRSSPKHTLELLGEPLLRLAFERAQKVAARVLVVTEPDQRESVRLLLPELGEADLIIEPEPRGTVNALGLASMLLARADEDAVMLSMAADQVVEREEEFERAVDVAVRGAEAGHLVTIGLRPTYAATGYGYIKAGAPSDVEGLLRVEEFVEKPSRERAEAFLREGRYFWNLSLFCWQPAIFLRELQRLATPHYEGLIRALNARQRDDPQGFATFYGKLPVDSVDYAVLERTDQLWLAPAELAWRDLGSWSQLYELLDKDAAGNVVQGEVALLDTKSSLVWSGSRLVAALGLEDMLVIETEDAVLVCPRARAEDVKKLVDQLRAEGRIRYL